MDKILFTINFDINNNEEYKTKSIRNHTAEDNKAESYLPGFSYFVI